MSSFWENPGREHKVGDMDLNIVRLGRYGCFWEIQTKPSRPQIAQ